MDSKLRIVTHSPLDELWREEGAIEGRRIRWLRLTDIAELLKRSAVEFAVAEVGNPLQWISVSDCFRFSKMETKPHILESESRAGLESFTGEYCYTASEWECASSAIPVVLLEKHH